LKKIIVTCLLLEKVQRNAARRNANIMIVNLEYLWTLDVVEERLFSFMLQVLLFCRVKLTHLILLFEIYISIFFILVLS